MLVSPLPFLPSCEQIALPLLVALDIGLHKLAQHIGCSPVCLLADSDERFTQVFLDPNSDASIFHTRSLSLGYTFVYPKNALCCKVRTIMVISLWLGHEDPGITHLYLEADLAMKEEALSRYEPLSGSANALQPPDPTP